MRVRFIRRGTKERTWDEPRRRNGRVGRTKRKDGRESDGMRSSSIGCSQERCCLAFESCIHVLRFISDGFQRQVVLEIVGRGIVGANRNSEKYWNRPMDSILWILFSSFCANERMSRPPRDNDKRETRFHDTHASERRVPVHAPNEHTFSEMDADSLVACRDLPSPSIFASDVGLERFPINAETMQEDTDAWNLLRNVEEQTLNPSRRTAEDRGRHRSITVPGSLSRSSSNTIPIGDLSIPGAFQRRCARR